VQQALLKIRKAPFATSRRRAAASIRSRNTFASTPAGFSSSAAAPRRPRKDHPAPDGSSRHGFRRGGKRPADFRY
jgi:hypothetical protein